MRLLLLLLFSFFVEAVFSQPFNFVTYREADGLPSGYVEHAFEDSRGYLWLSTFGGLSRFDGKNFVNYGIKEGLPSNLLDDCTEDSRGRLWIVTRKGVSMFDGKKFTNYSYLPDPNMTTYYRYVQPQEDGNIHISITDRLYKSSGNKLEPEASEPGFKDSAVVYRHILAGGIKVIATVQTLYIIYPDGTKKAFAGLTASHLKLCFRDKQLNSFYVLGSTGVYRWDNDALTRISSFTFNRSILTAFFEDRQKRLWIAAENEPVRIFNTVTGIQDSIRNLPILVTGFFQDRQGTIWISTFRGLVKVTESFISHFDKSNGLLHDDIRASGMADSNVIYMGMNFITGGRVSEYSSAVKKILTSEKPLSNVKTIVKAEDGSFYIFTYTGQIFQYTGKTITEQTEKTGRIFISGAAYDKNNDEQLLAGDNSIYRMSKGKITTANDLTIKGKPFRDINAMKADVYGNIWMNDNGDPLLKTEKGFVEFKPALQLPSNAGAEMAYSDETGCWFKTAGYGIIHVSRNKQGNYVKDFSVDKKDGLINDNVLSIVRDNNNYLWVATSQGLCYINLNGSHASGYTVHAVNADEGMDAPNWNLAYLEKDISGNIWLGAGNGIYKLDISRLKTGSLPPAVHITDIALAGRKSGPENTKSDSNYFLPPQQATFNYDQNNISFSFKGINLKTGIVKYSYILEQQDKEWSPYSGSENISYNNLQPGSYTFRVKAINDYGIESLTPATFGFVIRPPFWQRWWFRLVMAAVCILVIYLFVKRRDKNTAQKNALQLQMSELRLQAVQSQMNPHFIFNALNSIQNFIVQNNRIEAARYLSRFSKLIRRILDNSHFQFLKLEDVIETLKMYVELEAFRFNKEFTYSFHIDNSDERMYDVELPPMLLQPFVENAILHGLMPKEGEKHLKIGIFIKDNFLHCIIEDNGIGRKEKVNTGHISRGEKLTRGMLESLKIGRDTEAAILYEDLKDDAGSPTGTRVLITIPVT
jgi:ligand-binding sensor domain-containing protein